MTGTTAIIRETDTSFAFSASVAERRHAYEFWTTHNSFSALNEPPQSIIQSATGTTAPIPELLAYGERFLWLDRRFQQIINETSGELFFDGMDSPLAEKIRCVVYAHGTDAVKALRQALLKTPDEVEAGEEILRQIGLLRDKPTHYARLNLLTDMLELPQERIRDAASLGLSFMEDPAALPHLLNARRVETAPWVAEGFDQTIKQFEQTICPNT